MLLTASGSKNKLNKKQVAQLVTLLDAGVLVRFFDPQDGGDMFLRNAG
jgi:hypothetical protein